MKQIGKIYKRIAKRCNITVEQVKEEMQKELDLIFADSDFIDYLKYNGKKPTADEFLHFLINCYGRHPFS